MADLTLSRRMSHRKKKAPSGNLAYALFILLCFSVGAQLLNLIGHIPGIYEHLMQRQDTHLPQIDIGMGVGILFGLVPFLAGCIILGLVSLIHRLRHH